MATAITYNSFDLQDDNHITEEIGDDDTFAREVGLENRMRRAGAILTDDTFQTKPIPVTGLIKSTSVAAVEQLIDEFKAAMAVRNKQLDIGYGSGTRRYIATPTNVKVQRPVRAANWARYSVVFLATEFAQDTSSSTLVNAVNSTASPGDHALTITGSSPDQGVIVTIDINSFTGSSINTISLENLTTGQKINVTRAYLAGDSLVVNSETLDVTVNGDVADFSGAFPTFTNGVHTLRRTDDFTDRDVDTTVVQTGRWL